MSNENNLNQIKVFIKNSRQVKENKNLEKMDIEEKLSETQVNNHLLLGIKNDEILHRFRAKLKDIDKGIHKLISKLNIPESTNKTN